MDIEDFKYEDIKREVIDLRQKLEQEKQLRMILELRARTLDSHCQYKDKVHTGPTEMEPIHQPTPPVEQVDNLQPYSARNKDLPSFNCLFSLQTSVDLLLIYILRFHLNILN